MGLQEEIEQELRKDDDLLLRVGRGHWEDVLPIFIARMREVVERAEYPQFSKFVKECGNRPKDIVYAVACVDTKKAILKAMEDEQ